MKKFIKHKLDNFGIIDNNKILKKINEYDYVSFDIFDTLIKRDVPKPINVFSLIEKMYNLDGFENKRVNAERESRTHIEEVNLEDIYNCFSSINKEQLMAIERKTEEEVCVINKNIKEVYDYCVKHNKKIIIISDMYLDRKTIKNILFKNNIDTYDRLYISNELNMTKHSGKLFKHVLNDLKISSEKLLHIGNDIKADYYSARKNGIEAIKIPTYYNRKLKEYHNSNHYLNHFINNHTYNKNFYFDFGFERLGPLLYGFIEWLHKEFQQEDIQQVLFLARDGHIMKDIYDMLGYDKEIPSYYFEASRRSLRVPYYARIDSLEEIVQNLSIPTITNMMQVFDSLGLDYNDYVQVILKHNYKLDSTVLRKDLLNDKFRKLYNEIAKDIQQNACQEKEYLEKYLRQFDFSHKTAIVDIGWGASMQKYLLHSLKDLNIEADIFGYYLGLTKKSLENLDINKDKAKAYLFDNFNRVNEFEKERPFVGLFESLFLEQDGSVKRYVEKDDSIIAERYPYEYKENGRFLEEVDHIVNIQEGARKFVKDYCQSPLKAVISNQADVMFDNLYNTGISPNLMDVDKFGFFVFFNNGNKRLLAEPHRSIIYLFRPKKLIQDISNSQWKIGFLKKLLIIPLPYLKIFNLLQKMRSE